VHTNDPAGLFNRVEAVGSTRQIKVDDMRRQYEAGHRRRHPVALVTDSACDLPQDYLDKHQIHVIPFNLHFGSDLYLDRLTIHPPQFYHRLQSRPEHPTTAQPNPAVVQNLLSFLSGFYDSILVFHISSGLSGTFEATRQLAGAAGLKRTDVVDTRTLSLSQGLIVMRAAEALGHGLGHEEILRQSRDWVKKSRLLVDVATMKYFVRGGRVSPVKGLLAGLLHIKPIITLDEAGRASEAGKVFSRKTAMARILRAVTDWSREHGVWKYAVVHVQNRPRAEEYAARLTTILGAPPAFIQDVTPVIGVHAGPGTVAVTLQLE
jgi:DegV family protein with EDD domain